MSAPAKEYPPERLAELAYVNRDEYGHPDEDWGLRSEFTKPWYVEVDDVDCGVTWSFGPQGHPGSLSIHLHLFEEDGFKPTLHVLGPDVEDKTRTRFHGAFSSSRYLKALLIYGHRLQERFGTDHFWHRCREGCWGSLPTTREGPPYRRCPDCEAVSAQAKEEVRQWVAENPFPQPSHVGEVLRLAGLEERHE